MILKDPGVLIKDSGYRCDLGTIKIIYPILTYSQVESHMCLYHVCFCRPPPMWRLGNLLQLLISMHSSFQWKDSHLFKRLEKVHVRCCAQGSLTSSMASLAHKIMHPRHLLAKCSFQGTTYTNMSSITLKTSHGFSIPCLILFIHAYLV